MSGTYRLIATGGVSWRIRPRYPTSCTASPPQSRGMRAATTRTPWAGDPSGPRAERRGRRRPLGG